MALWKLQDEKIQEVRIWTIKQAHFLRWGRPSSSASIVASTTALNLPDDSSRGLELHNRRKEARHAAFDSETGIPVVNWGNMDDTRSHEYVQLLIALRPRRRSHRLLSRVSNFWPRNSPRRPWTSAQLVKALFAKLRRAQEEKRRYSISQ